MELEHLLGKLKMDHLEAQLDAICEHRPRSAKLTTRHSWSMVCRRNVKGGTSCWTELQLRHARFP